MASSENPQYRSRNALVRRHIDKMDAGYKVGTKEFNLASVGDIDSVDDLLIDNVARFLLKAGRVGQLVDGSEVALDYTPELGVAMLKQYPDLYWLILAEAASIAQGKEQQTQETVKAIEAQKWLKEFGESRVRKQSGAGRNSISRPFQSLKSMQSLGDPQRLRHDIARQEVCRHGRRATPSVPE